MEEISQEPQENCCTFCPDVINGIRITDLCKVHDLEYSYGLNRLQADRRLRDGIAERFAMFGKTCRGLVVSQIIYRAVRTFGWLFWGKRNPRYQARQVIQEERESKS